MKHLHPLRKAVALGIAAAAFCAAPAWSAVVVLNFAGLNGNAQERPLNFYNGGTGSLGSAGGAALNYGISFGNDALSCSGQPGGACNTSAIPGGPGANALFFLTGPGAVMNVAAGFTTGFSFFYSAINLPGIVSVYDGLNGTGTLLATLNLPVTSSTPGFNGCAPVGSFCPYFAAGVSFAGNAKSVNFSGTADQVAFGAITLGSATPGGTIPEPTSVTLVGLSLLAAAGARRRLVA